MLARDFNSPVSELYRFRSFGRPYIFRPYKVFANHLVSDAADSRVFALDTMRRFFRSLQITNISHVVPDGVVTRIEAYCETYATPS